MNILDIDLDFFLDNQCLDPGETRLSSKKYCPWKKEQVRGFLQENCGLDIKSPIRGYYAKTHDQLFNRVVENHFDKINLYHIDAHDDLYVGSYIWVMTELLAVQVEKRPDLIQKTPNKLNEGNVVGFLLACQKLSSVTFVTNTEERWDKKIRTRMYHRVFNENCPFLQLPSLPDNYDAEKVEKGNYDYIKDCSSWVEPAVPYNVVNYKEWKADVSFDYIFFCQSPLYTPETSDGLIPIIQEYMTIV